MGINADELKRMTKILQAVEPKYKKFGTYDIKRGRKEDINEYRCVQEEG